MPWTSALSCSHTNTYPKLVALFEELDVPTTETDMSFSVSLGKPPPEWAGTYLNTIFAQRRNLLRPAFLRVLSDVARLNGARAATRRQCARRAARALGHFFARERLSDAFHEWYLLPMIGAIWSCPVAQMLAFPVGTLVRFCHNHGSCGSRTVRAGGPSRGRRDPSAPSRACSATSSTL
ncbi:hypothetical protein [Caballeronia sp. LZ031]|nr:hypothetical protein [Caballeronia sp. LZ031]MDR5843481.1 hypothetical protein [Caballeronia sp. LZ031]